MVQGTRSLKTPPIRMPYSPFSPPPPLAHCVCACTFLFSPHSQHPGTFIKSLWLCLILQACYLPIGPDGVPIIGEVPGIQGVYMVSPTATLGFCGCCAPRMVHSPLVDFVGGVCGCCVPRMVHSPLVDVATTSGSQLLVLTA